MAHVREHVPSREETLSSNPSTAEKKKKKKKKQQNRKFYIGYTMDEI
jgi:hypothetical protein